MASTLISTPTRRSGHGGGHHQGVFQPWEKENSVVVAVVYVVAGQPDQQTTTTLEASTWPQLLQQLHHVISPPDEPAVHVSLALTPHFSLTEESWVAALQEMWDHRTELGDVDFRFLLAHVAQIHVIYE